MRYVFFDLNGRVTKAVDDETITIDDVPLTASVLTDEQWDRRFDLQMIDGNLVSNPAVFPSIVYPDIAGFKAQIKASVGGIIALNTLLKSYPVFVESLELQHWADVSELVVNALNTSVITQQQYADFQLAFTANSIPISLP
jgi:hypothetical protein